MNPFAALIGKTIASVKVTEHDLREPTPTDDIYEQAVFTFTDGTTATVYAGSPSDRSGFWSAFFAEGAWDSLEKD